MTRSQWKKLQIGTILRYVGNSGSEYTNTLYEIITTYPDISLKIITSDVNGYKEWETREQIASYWTEREAFQFEIEFLPLSLEERITLKIKTLDTNWAKTQAKKENKYAMLCL